MSNTHQFGAVSLRPIQLLSLWACDLPGQETCLQSDRGLTQPGGESRVKSWPFGFWERPEKRPAPQSHCGRYFCCQTLLPRGALGSFQGRRGQRAVWGRGASRLNYFDFFRTHCCNCPRLSELWCSSSCKPPATRQIISFEPLTSSHFRIQALIWFDANTAVSE